MSNCSRIVCRLGKGWENWVDGKRKVHHGHLVVRHQEGWEGEGDLGFWSKFLLTVLVEQYRGRMGVFGLGLWPYAC